MTARTGAKEPDDPSVASGRKSGSKRRLHRPSAAASVTNVPMPAPAPSASASEAAGRIPRQPQPAAALAEPSTRVAERDPDKRPTQTTGAEAKAPRSKVGENKVPENSIPENSIPENSIPENKAPAEVLSTSKAHADKPAERPPADWEHFAPPPARAPGAPARFAARAGRLFGFVRHEWFLTVLGGLALSLLVNRGALIDLAHTLPHDSWDPSLVAYLIAWDGFALLHFPGDLWQINAFFPSGYGLAYSDALLGYAPFALIGTGPEAAVLRYNIIAILAQALTFVGGYALVRQLGAARVAATVAAVAFALAPWRLSQVGHLQVLSTGGIVLALAMLARAHGVRWRTSVQSQDAQDVSLTTVSLADTHSPNHPSLATAGPADAHSARSPDERPRPPKRAGWAIAGWLCATWQVTIGFGIGLVFGYVLLGACAVGLVWWAVRSRRLLSRGLLAADVGGGIVFAGTSVLLVQPYLRVLEHYPNIARTDEWIAPYSPPLRGFFTAPETSLVWGALHAPSRAMLSLPGEMALLPGFALYALAAAGLLFSTWRVAVRLALLAGVVVTVLLGLGTHGPAEGHAGYLWLLRYLPGIEGLRMPGRLIIWTTLFLALLAAGGVGALAARVGEAALRNGLPRPTATARLALLLPLVLVLVEGLGTTPHVAAPAAPTAVATAKAPFLVLPSTELQDMRVMLWSTDRFANVLNGGGGLVPAEIAETRKQVQRFPDAQSVGYLRQTGVNTVVVLPNLAKGTVWEAAASQPIDDLGITREVVNDAVVFHLTS